MFQVTVICEGLTEAEGKSAAACVQEEFSDAVHAYVSYTGTIRFFVEQVL
jgi:hypothetical protein